MPAPAGMRNATLIAFNELDHALNGVPKIAPTVKLADLPSKAPLFVTWTKKDRLRGCIGTFAALPLPQGIEDYAIISALKDTRFKPIKPSEFPELEVAVTVLGPLEPIEDTYDWEIGVHGVKAVFPHGLSSTFLPDVVEEQRWTKQETIWELASKAGADSIEGVKMYRYTGTKAKMSYKEYLKYRDSGLDYA